MAEVSYYSYEYDSDSEPFLADAEGGHHYDLSEGGDYVEQKVVLPVDTQITTLETKNIPERWYELFHLFFFPVFLRHVWCFILTYS